MWTSSFALCGMLNNGKKTDWKATTSSIRSPRSSTWRTAPGIAVVHPAYLEYLRERGTAPCPLRRTSGHRSCTRKSEQAQAKEGIAALKKFFHEELGAPATLRALGVPESCFARVAELTNLSCYSYRQLTADDVMESSPLLLTAMERETLEKLYAGLIGMDAGMRLGAPVENPFWTYERLQSYYSDIRGYLPPTRYHCNSFAAVAYVQNGFSTGAPRHIRTSCR